MANPGGREHGALWVPWRTCRLGEDAFDYIRDQGVAAGKSLGPLLKPRLRADAFVVETYVPQGVPSERLSTYTGAIRWTGEPPQMGPSGLAWLVARLHTVLAAQPSATLIVPDAMSSASRLPNEADFYRQVGVEAIGYADGDYYVLRPGEITPEGVFYAIHSASNAWMEFGAVTTAPVPAGTLDTEDLESIAGAVTHVFQTVYDGDSWLLATRS